MQRSRQHRLDADASHLPRRVTAAWRVPEAKYWGALVLAALMIVATVLPANRAAVAAEEPDVQALMRRVDELWRGTKSSHARMTMVVETRRYRRSITMDSWSEGSDKSLITILAPKKDRGISTLKVDRNIWNYLPKINRVTKIPPSMMMGSWMGSHFTNDDLVRDSSYENDYASSLTFSGERDGKRIYELTSVPRPDAAVVWGKVVTVIEQDTLLPVLAVYYDEDGEQSRTMRFEEPRRMGDRMMPTRMVLIPADKEGESTVVIYEEIAFDVDIPPGLFSLRGLSRQ